MDIKEKLVNKLQNRDARIGIIGLGYVGLPLAIRFTDVGHKVTGFDTDDNKIEKLNTGTSYIEHIDSQSIASCIKQGITFSSDFSLISEMDGIILCVPTPLTKDNLPDLTYIRSSMESIFPYLRHGQIISLESTTYPGTTEEEIVPLVKQKGLVVGENIFVVYSPEREDPGRKDHSTQTIPKICGGVTSNCLEAGLVLYGKAIDQLVPMTSTRAADCAPST